MGNHDEADGSAGVEVDGAVGGIVLAPQERALQERAPSGAGRKTGALPFSVNSRAARPLSAGLRPASARAAHSGPRQFFGLSAAVKLQSTGGSAGCTEP